MVVVERKEKAQSPVAVVLVESKNEKAAKRHPL